MAQQHISWVVVVVVAAAAAAAAAAAVFVNSAVRNSDYMGSWGRE